MWNSIRRVNRRISSKCRLAIMVIIWTKFGLSTPVNLDLQVINITFGLMFKINIASILGIVIAIFLYRFMR